MPKRRFSPATGLIGIALLLAACESPPTSAPLPAGAALSQHDGEPRIAWLRAKAVPITTTTPGGDAKDLRELGKMVGNARIVGLGEATHGSREFFEMKHRVVEYLVRERGFRVFGIEASFAEATRVNRYIHTGEGDVAVLLSNLYLWPWNTQEVTDMIQWMRAYNQSVPADRRVSFYGFDIQFDRVAMTDVMAYLSGVDPAGADSARAWYACYYAFRDSVGGRRTPDYGAAPEATRTLCRTGVQATHAWLQARAGQYVPRSDRLRYESALRAARTVVQNEHLRANPEQFEIRDQYMAENAAWLAEVVSPNAGVVLWAHNGHVSRMEHYMGAHLADRFGARYVVAGFSFNQGGFNASGPPTFRLGPQVAPPAREDSYEYQFQRVGYPRFYVDLRPVADGRAPKQAEWLAGPLSFRSIGSYWDPANPDLFYWPEHHLPETYDLMIHISDVTPTRLLPFRFR